MWGRQHTELVPAPQQASKNLQKFPESSRSPQKPWHGLWWSPGFAPPGSAGRRLTASSVPSPPQISAVRLPREPTNPERLKGFGYAEFEDIDSLFQALSLNEEVSAAPRGPPTSGAFLRSPGG